MAQQHLSSTHLGAFPLPESLLPWHERMILQLLTAIHKELVEARRERYLARKAAYETACADNDIPSNWTEEFQEELP